MGHAGYADTLITDDTSITENNKSHARAASYSVIFAFMFCSFGFQTRNIVCVNNDIALCIAKKETMNEYKKRYNSIDNQHELDDQYIFEQNKPTWK